jgi:CpeT protein
MTKRMLAVPALLVLLTLIGCAGKKSETTILAEHAVRATLWLEGSFSSAEQAAADERYFEVILNHAKIWPNRGDGFWFYVEQAIANRADQPYRQRIYRVWIRGDRKIESAVYEMPHPDRYTGAYKDTSILDDLSPDDLYQRVGCEVVFHELGDGFMLGETVDQACSSTLRGATYATSKVRLSKDEIQSWDQGWDADGAQVWGAEAGPYVFKRID